MTIYMRGGKPIIKNGGFVTGDCCCGCDLDNRCGSPHVEIDLSGQSSSGAIIKGAQATIRMSFDNRETSQMITRKNDGSYSSWSVDKPGKEWDVSCDRDVCKKKTRKAWIDFTKKPNACLREYGTLFLSFTGTAESSSEPAVSYDFTVTHQYLGRVWFYENSAWTELTVGKAKSISIPINNSVRLVISKTKPT